MHAQRRRKQYLWCWIFVLPTTLFYAGFQAWPILSSFYYSMLDWSGISSSKTFVGLANFAELLQAEKLPSAFLSFATLLVPIILIFANTLVSQITALEGTMFANVVEFLGQPVIALFIALCMGAFLLCREFDKKTCVDLMQQACCDAGPIAFITAAGGALGAVINATGAASMMADWIVSTGIPAILIPIIIGVVMRFPQGSGTTAMITGSAIVAPMIAAGLQVNPYLAALALCLGPVLSRGLSGLFAVTLPNARGTGLLATFTGPMDAAKARVVLAVWAALAAAAMVLLSPWTGAGALAGAALVCLYYVTTAKRQFGGVTGDLAGFFLQLCELGMVLGAAAAQRMEVLV